MATQVTTEATGAATLSRETQETRELRASDEPRASRDLDVTRPATGNAGRLVSLDVLRGATIAGMILVNNPGSWSHIYWPLEHAEWNGWTPTDLIFPFFLFIVGVSITLALGRRVESGGQKRDLYLKIVRRFVLIYAFGFLLATFPFVKTDQVDFTGGFVSGLKTIPHGVAALLAVVRLTGVLQRIAFCYLFAALIFVKTTWRTQSLIAAALLVLYCVVLTQIATPGYAAGDLSKQASIASFVDRKVLGTHIWKGGDRVYDPEGILSTFPAIATTLLGVLAGHWLRRRVSDYEKVAGLFVAGAILVAAGWCWNPFFPINKSLWTSSYVLFTAGLALQLLAVCYWLIDIKGYKRWSLPFRVFGVNALAVFVLTGLMARVMTIKEWWNFTRTDGTTGANLQTLIYQRAFASWLSPNNASLAFAVCFVLLWLGLMAILYKKKIYIKV
jgi:predicted acyltransferase